MPDEFSGFVIGSSVLDLIKFVSICSEPIFAIIIICTVYHFRTARLDRIVQKLPKLQLLLTN